MFDICLVASPGSTWEQQWSYLLSHFEPRDLYVIGEVDPRVRPFKGYIQIQTAEELPGILVLMAPIFGHVIRGEESLRTFQHPDECCYMFGADNAHLTEDHLGSRIPDHKVYIPTDTRDQMYSFMAGAITLYDRTMTRG